MNYFLDYMGDFYGSMTVDDFAERLGLTTRELMEELQEHIEESYDSLVEEMGFLAETEDEEE